MKFLVFASLIAFCSANTDYSNFLRRNVYDPERNSLLKSLNVKIPYDGKGNNIKNKEWGAKDAPLDRMSKAHYKDGKAGMVDKMPLAREISNGVVKLVGPIPNNKAGTTALFTFWGQLMDHDLSLTPEQDQHTGEHIDIRIPKGDPFMDPKGTGNVKINMLRSKFIKGSEPRKLVNVISAFIDGTIVYGADQDRCNRLRSHKDGKMKVSEGNFLPFDDQNPKFHIAGDTRANQNIALNSLHTLFVREHNRRAEQIKAKFSDMDDEQIFQLSRQWVIALLQKITYEDWLPTMIGPHHYLKYIGSYKGYNQNVDASIFNEFSSAGFRVGHSLLVDKHPQIDERGRVTQNLGLKDMFLKPEMMKGDRLDQMFRGLSRTPNKQKTCQVIDDVRNFLILNADRPIFLDLVSFNINRNRDHGLPGYNDMRGYLGLPKIGHYTEITADVESGNNLDKVYNKRGYSDASGLNADLWVGIVCEKPVYGGIMGEVGADIIGQTFKRVRDGDRFWYENIMDFYMRTQVKKTTLGDIIRWNTGAKDVQDDPFHI